MNITKLAIRASLILLFLTMTSVFVQAQQDDIKQYKIAFFTEKLELTETEAESFWPVYNEYEKEKKELRVKFNDDDGPDAKVEQMEAEMTLLKEYNAKFKEVLSDNKVGKLHKAEKEFKEILIKMLQNR